MEYCINELNKDMRCFSRRNFGVSITSQNTTTFFNDIFMFCQVLFFSLLLSSCFVSHFVYVPLKNMYSNEDDKIQTNDEDEKECYINKYPIKEAVHNNSKRVNNNSFITEMTPYGYVIMGYDYEREGFKYWSDRSIPFEILEVVARKFVSYFHCSNLYINRFYTDDGEDKDNIRENNENNEEEDNENNQENENIITNTDEKNTNDEEKEETKKEVSPFAQLKKKNNNNSRKPKKETNACKFIRLGKINDFQLLQSIEIESPTDKLDFSTFKKMYQSMQYNIDKQDENQ